MCAVPADDEQGRLDLLRPLHDHLERLAHEDLRLDRNLGELLRHDLGALQVRLAKLEQTLIDDVVVELLLLLELEHLRGLHREDVLDIPEDDVVIFHVEGAAHIQGCAQFLRQLEGAAHRVVGIRRPVDADHKTAALQGGLLPNDEHVLLDLAQGAGDDAAELRVRLAPEAVGADGNEIVFASGRADELRCLVLLFSDDSPVLTESNVASGFRSAVITGGAIGIEADEARQASLAAIHLAHDLLVVDPLEELPGQRDAGALTAQRSLVEKAIGDQLQPFLDQLVVNFALVLDLFRRLELRGKSGLELTEADVMEPRRVNMIAGDAPS